MGRATSADVVWTPTSQETFASIGLTGCPLFVTPRNSAAREGDPLAHIGRFGYQRGLRYP
jgi:hypothetical protein